MRLTCNEALEIVRFSDELYEKITAEIRYKGEPIAQVNQDKEELEIELFTDFGGNAFDIKLPFGDFLEAIEAAKPRPDRKQ